MAESNPYPNKILKYLFEQIPEGTIGHFVSYPPSCVRESGCLSLCHCCDKLKTCPEVYKIRLKIMESYKRNHYFKHILYMTSSVAMALG